MGNRFLPRRWLQLLALLAGGCLAGRATAGKPLIAPADTVVLPPLIVKTQQAEFQHWIKAVSPHFIVYTDASRKKAERVLRQMEALRLAVPRLLGREFVRTAPMILVLPTADSDWSRLAAKGLVEWDPTGTAIDLPPAPAVVVQDAWEWDGMGKLYTCYGYEVPLCLDLPLPFWFSYGFGQVLSTARCDEREVELGQIEPRQSDNLAGLRRDGWLSWAQFFAVGRQSPEFVRKAEIGNFSAQADVFMHYLLFRPEPVGREQLLRWGMRQSEGNPPTEDAFQAMFGQAWPQWQEALQDYIRSGGSPPVSFRVPPMRDLITFPPLPAQEMRDLFVLVQIFSQNTDESQDSLDHIMANGLRTESLRGLLVRACVQQGRPLQAVEQLRMMIDAGTDNPQVYEMAAMMVFSLRVPQLSLQARVGGEESELRAWCRRALRLEPKLSQAASVLAWTEALAETVDRQSVESIQQLSRNVAADGAPRDQITCALAVASWRAGALAEARSCCDRLLQDPDTPPGLRWLAKVLQARLTAVARPPAAHPDLRSVDSPLIEN